jgi:GNAT superfamily N-acetyltransferase
VHERAGVSGERSNIEVRLHDATELRTLVAIAGRAFWDDPLFNVFVPDMLTQHRHLSGFFSAAIDDAAAHGKVYSASIGSKLVGVAAWLPPGVTLPTNGRRAAAQARRALPAIARSPKRAVAYRLMNELPKHHLHAPHWYLAVLATDPSWQGRGVGTALLEPVLRECDEQGFPAYLETQKESNLAYYNRYRFNVTTVINVVGAPPVWTMTRPPIA